MSDDTAKTTHSCLHCALLETAAVWMKEHQGIDAIATNKGVAFPKLKLEHHSLLAATFAMATGDVVGHAPANDRSLMLLTASLNLREATLKQAGVTDAVKN